MAKTREATDKEIIIGRKASEKLAEAIHAHHRECACDLCKAWWALRKVDVLGIVTNQVLED